MRAIAHGWKPDHMDNPPSMAVAKDFEAADAAKEKPVSDSTRIKKRMKKLNPAMF